MNETEWLASSEPEALLDALRDRAGSRKVRLFACACCRRVWSLLTAEPLRRAVETAERFADGLCGWDELEEAHARGARAERPRREEGRPHTPGAALSAARQAALLACSEEPARAVEYASAAVGYTTAPTMTSLLWRAAIATERRFQASLLRCLFGNAFRPVALDSAWLTPAVASLALAAYEERQLPSGELDLSRLLVLSDALEEGGASANLLGHLRASGPHARGCWPVDLVTGRG